MNEWQDKLQDEANTELEALLGLNEAIAEEERVKKETARNLAAAVINSSQVRPKYNIEAQLKALDELYRKGFSKVVVLADESGNQHRYRITQANTSLIKMRNGKDLNVVNRLAPLASKLITAQIDDEIEHNGKIIGFVEHIDFVHKSVLKNDEIELLELIESEEDFVTRKKQQFNIKVLREFETRELAPAYDEVYTSGQNGRELDSETTVSLSSDFYTNTTKAQEELIQLPNRGTIAVLGIAGSGKTSIALGRVKKLYSSNQFDHDEEGYDDFFRDPRKMVGFVLHKQLVPYLKDTCTELDMGAMPIKEYKEHQKALLTHYKSLLQLRMNNTGKYTRSSADFVFSEQCKMEWLRNAEKSITHKLLDDVIANLALVEKSIIDVCDKQGNQSKTINSLQSIILDVWREFKSEAISRISKRKTLAGKWGLFCIELVNFLNRLASEWTDKISAEKRYYLDEGKIVSTRPDVMSEAIYPFSTIGKDSKTSEAIEKIKTAVSSRVRSAFFLSDSGAKLKVTDKYLAFLAELSLDSQSESFTKLYKTVSELKLTKADIDLLICICDLMCWKTASGETVPAYLSERAKYTSVFIDEVQDFTELEVFSMALQADPRRAAVTVVGDFMQQLYPDKVRNLADCLPMMQRKDPYILNENKRQNPVLARYSQYVRDALDGQLVSENKINLSSDELQKLEVSTELQKQAIADFLREAGNNKTVCIICPTYEIAEVLESDLREMIEEELWRESHVTKNSTELNKAFYIHFTTPTPTKGLEFDMVVIPNFEMMTMDNTVSGHHTYVAVSRAKEKLLLLEVNK